MNKFFLNILQFLFLQSLLSLPLNAQPVSVDPDTSKLVKNHIASVLMTKGEVYKIKDGKGEPIPIALNQRFNEGDQIKTYKNSFLKLKTIDNIIINIGPYSDFKFNKFSFSNKEKSVFTLARGKMRAFFSEKSKQTKNIIKTKTASMGVRGTRVAINVLKKNGKDVIQHALTEGEVEITSNLTKKSYILKARDEYISYGNRETLKKLTEKEFKQLKQTALNKGKKSSPFLYEFEPSKDDLKLFENTTSLKNQKNKIEQSKSKENWEENLKKLNDKLKQNN